MSLKHDKTGKVYGRLTVIRRSDKQDKNGAYWDCQCSCGGTTTIAASKIGYTKSCGCLKLENPPPPHRTHGASYVDGKPSVEYRTWASMKNRCNDARNPNYGGRGISVCPDWADSFEAFLSDMGPRPSSQHSLDRIDVNLGYSSENCRWATSREQSNNRRTNNIVEWQGMQMTVTEAARLAGKNVFTVRNRIQRGWTFERAIQ